MLRILSLAMGTAWACLCACGLLLAVQGLRATRLDQEPGQRPWVEVSPALSADGRVVAFAACRHTLAATPPRALGRPAPGSPRTLTDIVVVDLESGTATNLTRAGNGSSSEPRLDGTGRRLVFTSEATNLAEGGGHGVRSIHLLDRASGLLRRLPPPGPWVGHDASAHPTLSADGRWGAFSTSGLEDRSDPIGLRRVVVFDVASGRACQVNLADRRAGPVLGRPEFSPDARLLSFAAFAPGRDCPEQLATVFTARLDRAGQPSGPAVTAVSEEAGPHPGSGASDRLSLSPAQANHALAWVRNGPGPHLDVWVRDESPARDERVSVTPRGEPGNEDSFEPSISADGRWVAFTSLASDLVDGDRNGVMDVFLRDRREGTTVLVSRGADGRPADGPSYCPSISADGRRIAFVSRATNLGQQPCAAGHIFVWDRSSGRCRRLPLP